LGLETIDIYYLHNPETQLAVIDRKEFLSRIRAAFELLERKAGEGKIGVYGTATWNGYRAEMTDRGWLSLSELLQAANEVGGENHHFRAIQLPYNLAMPEAVTRPNQSVSNSKATALAAAHAMGLSVFASASLLQGQLARNVPSIVADAFEGLGSDAQRSVQFVRSTPGVDVALVGMRSVDHVRDILAAASKPPATREQLMKLFQHGDAR
ncbi:MAG TPA: aldo/keto reductase, partial [Candidatus Binataceae bacterium]